MKYLPIILLFLLSLGIVGCRKQVHNNAISDSDCDSVVVVEPDFVKSNDPDGLEFWTYDTIVRTNHRLVSLMDTLYRYVRGSYTESGIRKNIKWMQNYRNRLCNYYRETRLLADGISEFAMADSVIAEANNLFTLDKDESTLGLLIDNNVKRTRLVFQHYNEFEKLLNKCENETQKQVLFNEFTEWDKLESLFGEFFHNCMLLDFCGGSFRGPIRAEGRCSILDTHIDMYRKENDILSHNFDSWEDNGTFLKPARNLLNACCEQAVDEYYDAEETNIEYKKIYIENLELLDKLPQQVYAWCKARQLWEEEMCSDCLRSEYPRHTAEVLIKLAHIISSVQ